MGDIPSIRWQRLRPLLDHVLDLDGAARREYLAKLDADDEELCRDLRQLLEQYESLGSRSFSNAMDLAAPGVAHEIYEDRELDQVRVGQSVGSYRLLKLLGTGGMGAVYLAERSDEGFTHSVALKVVRKTLGSEHARERFERERQILAGLKHPGIALLFDGGQTSEGQSFYTMEYVDGTALGDYCTEHHKSVAERIRLLIDVGSALAYAHLNLIVHRDIKSSNVLVTADERVKLVDFGLAKLLDEHKLPTTTQFGMGPMTPAYAAPEQFLGGATTVATDIYQFGVLCFLILSNRLPYREDPNNTLEWARAVTEKDPLSLAHAAAIDDDAGDPSSAAAVRYRRQLTRDLDAIVHKALAKSPGDRYRSMDAMIADLEAFLEGRPVVARRAGPMYYLWRFLLRWRYATASAVLAFLALAIVALVAVHQSTLATDEARRANREADRAGAVADFLVDLFKVSDPGVNRGEHLNANEILERGSARLDSHFADQPQERAQFLSVIGEVYLSLGDMEKAEVVLQRSTDLFRKTKTSDRYAASKSLRLLARTWNSRGDLMGSAGLLDEAEALLTDNAKQTFEELARIQLERMNVAANSGDLNKELREIQKGIDYTDRTGNSDKALAFSLERGLGVAQGDLGQYDNAVKTFRRARATAATLYKEGDPELRQADQYLGEALVRVNELTEAATMLEPLDLSTRKQFGERSVEYGKIMETLGDLARRQANFPLALQRLAASELAYRSAFGESHPAPAWVIISAGEILIEEGKYEDALARMQEALTLRRRFMPEGHPEIAHSYYAMGEALVALGRYPEALEYTEKALPMLREKLPVDHPLVVLCMAQLGLLEYALHGRDAAHAAWDEALDRASRTYPPQSPELAKIRATIANPDALLAAKLRK